jgi:hypothetical protein
LDGGGNAARAPGHAPWLPRFSSSFGCAAAGCATPENAKAATDCSPGGFRLSGQSAIPKNRTPSTRATVVLSFAESNTRNRRAADYFTLKDHGMPPETDKVTLTALPGELVALTGRSSPGLYRKLWTMAVEGLIPAAQHNGRWQVNRSDIPAIARAVGLARPRVASHAAAEHAAA